MPTDDKRFALLQQPDLVPIVEFYVPRRPNAGLELDVTLLARLYATVLQQFEFLLGPMIFLNNNYTLHGLILPQFMSFELLHTCQ
jgi:hypothetical protein